MPAMTLLRHWYVDSVSQNRFTVFQSFKKTKFISEVILTEGDLHMHLFSMLKFSIKNLLSSKNYFWHYLNKPDYSLKHFAFP